MDEQLLREKTTGLLQQLQPPAEGGAEVRMEISARHVHLCAADVQRLFGAGYTLTPVRELSQPGQFLCEERVTLVGPAASIERVAVLGPARGKTQVELSASDARALGIDAPVRLSGDLANAADLLIVAGENRVAARGSAIIARNHIHMPPGDSARLSIKDGQLVRVRVDGPRPLVFEKVIVRVDKDFALRMHIDFDEANACMLKKEAVGIMLPEEQTEFDTQEGDAMNQQELVELIVREVRRQLHGKEQTAALAQKNILVLGDVSALCPDGNEAFHDVEAYRANPDIGRYDSVCITRMTNAQLCDVAIGRDSTPFCCAVLNALLAGVPVYLAEDAFSFHAHQKTAPAKLYAQLEWYEKRLREEYGVLPLSCRGENTGTACDQKQYDSDKKVITGTVAESLCKGEKKQLLFPRGTVITPSAKDVFHTRKVQVIREAAGGGIKQ